MQQDLKAINNNTDFCFRYGRKLTIILFVFLSIAVNLVAAFSPSMPVYGLFRSLAGICARSATNTACILGNQAIKYLIIIVQFSIQYAK